jgi:hypothetical protein
MSVSTKKRKISTVTLTIDDLKELEKLLSDLEKVEFTFEAKNYKKTVSKIDALTDIPVSYFNGMKVYARAWDSKKIIEIFAFGVLNEFIVSSEDEDWVRTKYYLLRGFFEEKKNKNWLLKQFPTNFIISGSITTLVGFSLFKALQMSSKLDYIGFIMLFFFFGIPLSVLFYFEIPWIVIEINHGGKIKFSSIAENVIAGLIVWFIIYVILWLFV